MTHIWNGARPYILSFLLTNTHSRKYETYTYQVQHISYRVRTHKTVSTVHTRKTRYFIFELLCTKNSLMIYRCYTYSLFSFLPFLSKSGFCQCLEVYIIPNNISPNIQILNYFFFYKKKLECAFFVLLPLMSQLLCFILFIM